ncbi:MAG: hypothetical protein ACK5YA_00680, partial [bacterium]
MEERIKTSKAKQYKQIESSLFNKLIKSNSRINEEKSPKLIMKSKLYDENINSSYKKHSAKLDFLPFIPKSNQSNYPLIALNKSRNFQHENPRISQLTK